MNRRQANRTAKIIFVHYGLEADVDWSETCSFYSIIQTEADEALVHDYFVRCADRVQDWLGV